jgi:hypothetical protein
MEPRDEAREREWRIEDLRAGEDFYWTADQDLVSCSFGFTLRLAYRCALLLAALGSCAWLLNSGERILLRNSALDFELWTLLGGL